MPSSNRLLSTTACFAGGALLATLALTGPSAVAVGSTGSMDQQPRVDSSQVVLDWERIAFSTIYPVTPIPVGVPILGFTSLAMYDAALDSMQRGRSSETAAVATAAHDVLVHYVPTAADALHAQLAASLDSVSDARARAKGSRIGHAAAAEMLASREGDGFGDPDVHYSMPPGPGVWQPLPAVPPAPPNTDMLAAWLGSLEPLVLDTLTEVDGPDPLTSAAYAADYEEVRNYGRAVGSARSAWQTDTALFFNSNSAVMVGDAMVRMLEADPVGLRRTALFFARMHASMTDSLIKCWELKRDVGFWRPVQAIPAAGTDGNPATTPDAGWMPLLATPNYSEYVSGHGCLTAPAVETVRIMFGEDTDLTLRWMGTIQQPRWTFRRYDTLTAIETQALNSRIWGGLHFRDAMDDAYFLGHDTARRVADRLG